MSFSLSFRCLIILTVLSFGILQRLNSSFGSLIVFWNATKITTNNRELSSSTVDPFINLYQQQISFVSLVKNCNHKGLGIYYLLSAFIFGISGTLISVLIRIELYSSGNRIISPENQNFYNISITLHGFLMIFFLVMPGLFGGFGNYFVPIFQGSPEVVYPRVNNFSILILCHSDIKDYPIIPLGFLDYSFHAFINITNLIWYTSFYFG